MSLRAQEHRRGSVLVIVLIAVVLLSLAVYRFTDTMVVENRATEAYRREVQARALAESGVQWAAAVLGEQRQQSGAVNLYDNPGLFSGILVRDAESDYGRGRFSIVAAREFEPAAPRPLRFGVVDESSRLNLNALLRRDLDDEQMRDVLMALPEMTVETADAILDWLDEDEQPRQAGAENEYYGTLDPAYSARNGPLESLNELLKVRGVTPWLLYGEDANRNGLLDANENDGPASDPPDDADGILRPGWSAYLTVHGREANRRADGMPRIDVNRDDLEVLYDDLAAEFDEATARFVVAYRLYGPYEEEERLASRGGSPRDSRGGGREGGRGSGGGRETPGGSDRRGGEGRSSGEPGSGDSGQSRVSIGAGPGEDVSIGAGSDNGGDGGGEVEGGTVMRGGLDLSQGASRRINSLYELIGTRVALQGDGGDASRILESPWSSNPGDLAGELPRLLDTLSTTSEPLIEGRINVNRAPPEVLLAVPEIDEQLAGAIDGARPSGAQSTDPTDVRSTAGWLVTDGLVTPEEMVDLDPWVTGGGDVYRVHAVGYYDGGGPAVRLEAILDATRLAPRVLSVRSLTALGRGYTPAQLGAASETF